MNNRLFSIIVTVLLITFVFQAKRLFAQSPEKIGYQTVIRNASDNLITNTTVGMQISILQASVNGAPVYVETQTTTSNINGLVSIEIGGGTLVSGDFASIDWEDNTYFIKTEIDLTGGTNYTKTSTSRFLSVPYAFHAKKATINLDTSKHYIGELCKGGIVFYVNPDGQHGLIASLEDINSGNRVEWSNINDVEIGSTSQSMTDGKSNTIAIIGQSAHTASAAKLCDDYSRDGFSDWYLPSSRELYLLFQYDILFNNILDNDGDSTTNGFVREFGTSTYGGYWSSTERDSISAFYFDLSGNKIHYNDKNDNFCRVRAIRSF